MASFNFTEIERRGLESYIAQMPADKAVELNKAIIENNKLKVTLFAYSVPAGTPARAALDRIITAYTAEIQKPAAEQNTLQFSDDMNFISMYAQARVTAEIAKANAAAQQQQVQTPAAPAPTVKLTKADGKTLEIDASNVIKNNYLKLEAMNIADVSQLKLSDHPNLQGVYLGLNGAIKDVSKLDLKANTNLQYLLLEGNAISDISKLDLSKNTRLVKLDLHDNKITNISAETLKALPASLKQLDVKGNPLNNESVVRLSSYAAERGVDLIGVSNTRLAEARTALAAAPAVATPASRPIAPSATPAPIAPVATPAPSAPAVAQRIVKLPKADGTTLDVDLSDVKIKRLSLFNSNISDVSNLDLSKHTALEGLSLNQNQISNVGQLNLQANKALTWLSANVNKIVDLEGLNLKENTALEHLILVDNQISDVSKLRLEANTKLKELSFFENEITDISELNLKENKVLSELDLGRNKITDISAQTLSNLPASLKKLDISNNPLNNASITRLSEFAKGKGAGFELIGITDEQVAKARAEEQAVIDAEIQRGIDEENAIIPTGPEAQVAAPDAIAPAITGAGTGLIIKGVNEGAVSGQAAAAAATPAAEVPAPAEAADVLETPELDKIAAKTVPPVGRGSKSEDATIEIQETLQLAGIARIVNDETYKTAKAATAKNAVVKDKEGKILIHEDEVKHSGPQTEAAVKSFQKATGILELDGITGRATAIGIRASANGKPIVDDKGKVIDENKAEINKAILTDLAEDGLSKGEQSSLKATAINALVKDGVKVESR